MSCAALPDSRDSDQAASLVYIIFSELAYQKGRLYETNTCADHINVVVEIGFCICAWLEEVPDYGFAATKQWNTWLYYLS